ncbi:MAG: TIGR04282 family arsenosugar biosynthesis glycosyltransferase [Candidatus Electrothrix aestuarii]|uniref:TIGR04282 family arsenosugar biosynthesis glycosyltransferase n=1 Tax=Candidatus Electrothrix aestuarii TaxID=3062594 RepID=A0AAU8LV43_9BACT|nr:TIGR04282 family arsenosugar biosynthesis glycosyltransferase [Candidatus Electrothrix aestuarii]
MKNNRSLIPHAVIILFTRYPQAGKVKTRLIRELGPKGAAKLHSKLTKQVISNLRPLLPNDFIQLRVSYCGGSKEEIQTWLGRDLPLERQQGNELGERMLHAFEQAWEQGAKQVLLIGSDCPGINPAIIESGLKQLKTHDLVLGPAVDGGYYLIGLSACLKNRKQDYPALFQDITWGTAQVLQQTLDQAKGRNLSFALLPELHDIDRPEDLVHLDYYTDSE